MRTSAVMGCALAPLVLLANCGVVGTVLSSVDASAPEGGGGAAAPDGAFESGDGQAAEDGRNEQDTGEPQAEAATLGGDSGPTTADASGGNGASACDVCSGGMTCQDGQCACPPGLFLCGDTCVDEQTDNANCSACGVACSAGSSGLAAACTQARCLVELAWESFFAEAIAVDATSVWWTEDGSGPGILTVTTGGGALTQLVRTDQNTQGAPMGIALDATNVYWTDNGPPAGDVMSMPKGGGTPVALASGQDGPCAIAVDATSVYWMNGCNVVDGGSGTGSVMKVPIGGGIATT